MSDAVIIPAPPGTYILNLKTSTTAQGVEYRYCELGELVIAFVAYEMGDALMPWTVTTRYSGNSTDEFEAYVFADDHVEVDGKRYDSICAFNRAEYFGARGGLDPFADAS